MKGVESAACKKIKSKTTSGPGLRSLIQIQVFNMTQSMNSLLFPDPHRSIISDWSLGFYSVPIVM